MEAHPNRAPPLPAPQRLPPTLGGAVRGVGVEGEIAVVTAGWQEREEEVDELREHLGGRVGNLRLYARAEEVFRKDRALARAHRQRQDRLQRMQELYRLRLDHAMEAARALHTRRGDPEVVNPEREAAVAHIRELDRTHLERVKAVNAELEATGKPGRRPAVSRHRAELAELLGGWSAFAVACGHVPLLPTRLRLFGIAEMIAGKPVFAWSGGAMVLGERL